MNNLRYWILTAAFVLSAALGIAQVDINSASAEELAEALKGVGLKRAERIVEYREKHGGFVSVEELTEVKGIGPATLKRNLKALKRGEYSGKAKGKGKAKSKAMSKSKAKAKKQKGKAE
ncbi:MAG: helix-hairpin-helix domain-containing protein [Gammaproteobacteria bacterium AqS3]|nr:helix-hairpin-helix domain-containing protein [Gammaproteobacteria bacterium AqS3]